MSIVTSRHPFVSHLAQALGLDMNRLTAYTVTVENNQPVTVTATYLVEAKTGTEGAEFLVQKFELRQIEP